MASNTGDMSTVRLQLGDRVFTTTMDTLNASPVLAAKFSQRWNSSTASTSTDMPAARKKRKPQKIFLDANPEIFQYILDFLRQNATPMIWDPQHGFDTNKYAAIYQMARYYGLNELAEWIKQAKYKSAVQHTLTYQSLDAASPPSKAKLFDADHVDINTFKVRDRAWVCPAAKSHHIRLGDCVKSCEEKRTITHELQAKMLERESIRVVVVRSHTILNADLLDA